MKKWMNRKTWRTLTVLFLTIAIALTALGEVANAYAPALNYALKTSSYKVIEHQGGEDDAIYFASEHPDTESVTAYGKAVSEEAEAEGMVLMKNKNAALPLKEGSSVSTVLQTAYNFSYGSSGSGAIDASRYTDLRTALESAGLTVNGTLWDFYAANPSQQAITYSRKGDPVYKVNALSWAQYSDEAKASIAQHGGTALVVVGRLGGEGADVSTRKSDGYDGSYLSLTAEEIGILAELTAMKNAGQLDSIVVLLNTADIFETAFLDDNWTVEVNGASYTVDVDACLWVGNVGIGGIQAVARALVGQVTPSGKLPDTYVKDNFSAPATVSWALSNDSGTFASKYGNSELLSSDFETRYGVYVEGIYVGYRYYETRYEDVVMGRENAGDYRYQDTVSRPFGYGLSYTTFTFSDYAVTEAEDGDCQVSVTVTNTGSVSGKEVVQVYLQKPYTDYDQAMGIEKASVELVGFDKTETLAPGQSQQVTITVSRDSFKTYDANGCETYILEPGEYYLAIGASAHDALNNILALKGKTTLDGMDQEGNAAFARQVGQDIVLDTTTYAVSAETGEAITNRLDFADINKYEGRGDNAVTYVSRSDWTGTFPAAPVILTATEQMAADLLSMKALADDDGATMPTYGAANGLSLIMLRGEACDAELWDDLLDQMTWDEQADLVTLAGYGTRGASSVALPEIKAEDGPTGVVDSAESVSFPSEGIWAATFNRTLIRRIGDALAEDALNVGVTGMYLPGVNIHRTPFGGRTHEYFSEDPYLSAEAVVSEVQGVQGKGVIPYVKHYAFNDEEDSRIGIGIWLNEQSAREIYLKPFEAAVAPSRGNAHGVMSSFNRAGCIWTSASSALMEDILRGEFGFDGVVLTDMALGQNAYMSYDAFLQGTDLFLDPSGARSQFDGYAVSASFRQAVRQAVHRYLYVIVNGSAAMNGFSASSEIVSVMPWWQALILGLQLAFFVLGGLGAAMLAASMVCKGRRRKTGSMNR
ncbi:MAG: glycoside hydrolase family 3 N-terminal domain-containing protein [Aristaeellaceae bacterium]